MQDYFLIIGLAGLLVHSTYQVLMFFAAKWSVVSNDNTDTGEPVPISVIVCARNEADNLLMNVPGLLSQSYSNYEVVLVNDASFDNTKDVMKAFCSKDERVRFVDIPPEMYDRTGMPSAKKMALTLGVKAASHDYLVFTDADCVVPKNWLSEFASSFRNGAEFVIGFGAYKSNASIISKVYAFEQFKAALVSFVFARFGRPYLAVGRSMGFLKSVFFDHLGYKGLPDIASGTDDLFLQKVRSKTRVVVNAKALSFSTPPASVSAWMTQRKRHLGAGKYYALVEKLLIASYEVSALLSFFVLFSVRENIWPTILLGVVLLLTMAQFYWSAKRIGKEIINDRGVWLPLISPLLNVFISGIAILKSDSAWRKK